MGLDGVELIMAVEDEFQITIEDAEAEQCCTVQKLVDVVHSRLRHSPTDSCLSQRGFYVVRRVLMDVLSADRARIKPDIQLDVLIGQKNRQELWRKIITSCAGTMDDHLELVRPTWLTILAVCRT